MLLFEIIRVFKLIQSISTFISNSRVICGSFSLRCLGLDRQHTVQRAVSMTGSGLHTGKTSTITIRPAAINAGIFFRRIDLPGSGDIPALVEFISKAPLCTVLAGPMGGEVSTIEHLMAAISAMEIDNLLIEINGPEVPIFDGSALPFLNAILRAEPEAQNATRLSVVIIEPIDVRLGASWARFTPSPVRSFGCGINFPDPAIGRQAFEIDLTPKRFQTDVAFARTFCSMSDVAAMQSAGRIKGGTLNCAVVFEGGRVLSPGGLRSAVEPATHKVLDAIGDIALFGALIIGRFDAWRPSHALNAMLLKEMHRRPSAWCQETEDEREAA
jgi:UDP-3-O-[3-hydroxymyristoyl] N-acetylglucosamine deacetylase